MTAAAAARTFLLPDLGEGLTEAAVLQWLVAVGDTVAIDQVVVEVETAKAAVEVPCPYGGVVTELHADPGTAVAVGTPLITVSVTIGAGVEGDPGDPGGAAGAAGAEQYREEERAGSGNVLIGYGTGGATKARRPRVRRNAESAPPVPAAAAASATPASSPAATGSTDRSGGAVLVLSPLVRNLARRHGVDLATVTATGAGGVIRRADVEAVIGGASVPVPVPAPAPAPAPGPSPSDPASPDPLRIPLTGLRKAVATKLGTSRREIPDATTWVDVDATELLAARRTLNAVPGTEPISLLALLARLCLAGLARFPELNSSVDTQRQEILRHRHVNLGIAAQTPQGLVVPVVPRADSLTTAELSQQIRTLAGVAKDGRLGAEHLTGGTFTLNNYGVFGVDGSTPIINYPEAAILGVGRVVDKPWVLGGQVHVRKVTQLSLSFDHRVCDGGVAGGFLRLVADHVENPVGLLRDV